MTDYEWQACMQRMRTSMSTWEAQKRIRDSRTAKLVEGWIVFVSAVTAIAIAAAVMS